MRRIVILFHTRNFAVRVRYGIVGTQLRSPGLGFSKRHWLSPLGAKLLEDDIGWDHAEGADYSLHGKGPGISYFRASVTWCVGKD
jgi:hypothetical protein